MPNITTPEQWREHRVVIYRVLDKDVKDHQRRLKKYYKEVKKNPQAQHPGMRAPQRDEERGRAINQMKTMALNIDKLVSELQYWEWAYSVKQTPENKAKIDKAQEDFETAVTLFNRFAMEHKLRFTQ